MNVHSQNTKTRGRPAIDGLRQRILDAALRVFAERGYHGTAVPLVAGGARIATGTLYRYFASKEELVNEVYRDAKARLGAALLEGLDVDGEPAALFVEIWRRLVRFVRSQPLAFRFLEMQDHTPYLDARSRDLERAVLGPIWLGAARFRRAAGGRGRMPPDVAIAFVWGALVGLFKAERLGYLALTDAALSSACAAAWTALAEPIAAKRRRS
jgi:TetR/AcrR family transcriptional regulator, repressor of fatR-cypB operon